MSLSDAVGKSGERAAEKVTDNKWVEGLARLGYLVRGVLYLLVGVIAVQVAIGARSSPEDKTGAIATIAAQPFGKILLAGVAIGLAGYSLWGLVRAVFDPLGKGTSPKGIAQRIGYVVSALSYGVLIIPTIRFIRGAGSGQAQGNGVQESADFLFSQPWGHALVIVVGFIAMGGAIGQAYMGITAKFKDEFKRSEMSEEEMKVATWVGRLGYVARGVVFLLGGFFLVRAGLTNDPGQAQGLDGALAALAHGSFGMPVLLAVALGLAAFGIYSILCTRWIKLSKKEW
jgi:hypothetical protein